MTGSVLDPFQRAKAVRYLLLQWPVDEIARAIHCDRSTIYRMQNNLWLYGSAVKPHRRPRGCPFKMTKASEDLVQFLLRNPTSSQAEMAWFLWEECGIRASQPTISRFLKRIKWSRNFFLVGVAGRELFPRRFRRRRRSRSFGRYKFDNIRMFDGEKSMWNGDVIDDNGGDDSWMRGACLTRQTWWGEEHGTSECQGIA
jgi:transposase